MLRYLPPALKLHTPLSLCALENLNFKFYCAIKINILYEFFIKMNTSPGFHFDYDSFQPFCSSTAE